MSYTHCDMPKHHKKHKHHPLKSKLQPTLAVLIPCFNEELGVKACLQSCLKQTRPFDRIIVVDDASTDNTVKVIEKNFKKQIQKKFITLIKLHKNKGNKSYVQEHGLHHITTDYFMCTDGDTVLDPQFVELAMRHFKDPRIGAVAGHVQSLKGNWLTACREIEYTITQLLHKQAQHHLGTVTVIPGCAGIFQTNVFKQHITFDHDTLTEDLDFTYKMHRVNKVIAYEPSAIVFTQDPADLASYCRQMKRWYAGNWQNLVKHAKTLTKKRMLAFETILTYAETSLLAILLLAVPFINIRVFALLLVSYLISAYISAIICSLRSGRKDVLLYAPAILLIIYINSFLFIREGIKVLALRQKEMTWYRAIRKEIT